MRIGINVPNELLQRLAPLKPELNISQVCREALEAKAASYERMRARLDDPAVQQAMGRVSEREQEFRALIAVDWEQLGYEDAVAWVQSATWEHWQDLHKRQEFLQRQGRSESVPIPPRLPDVKNFDDRLDEYPGWDTNQSDDFIDWLHYENISLDVAAVEREYRAAWMAYANAAWARFRQMEKEYAAERSKQRQEARRDRIPPQVPQQLLNRLSEDYQKIITAEPGKRSGQPCIRGTRITVYDVLEYLAGGMTEAEIRADFPELTHEDILACYAFAAAPERRIQHPQPGDPEPQPEKPPFRVVPHHSGFAPGVDEMNLNRLNAQLEEEELLAKLARSGPVEPKSDPQPQPEKPPFRVVPHHGKFAPGVAEMNLNHLAAELDDELYLAKMERDRELERQQKQENSQ